MSLKQFSTIFFLIGYLNTFSQITYQNAFVIGSSASDQAYKNVVDMQGNIYLTGSISGIADFDPGILTNELIAFGETDLWPNLIKIFSCSSLLALEVSLPTMEYRYK